MTDFTSKLSCVKNLLNSLPPNNVHILSKLMVLLHKVYKHSHINKMSSSNLAIVIAPNVLRRQVQTMETIITDTPLITSIVETMIMECPMLFDVSIPVADSASKSSVLFHISVLMYFSLLSSLNRVTVPRTHFILILTPIRSLIHLLSA